ncbi:MAG TPA: DUF222 domain-containing protein [Nocardioides sp.]|uniref:HNH endonuclease signature motif containing protein n=1 Tax=Nocardioides sp. TaxID=35761 RepID=UPI002D802029|nr:DUF222 domain-containing protein [Nocardioides sp.]HET6652487.1 DUF222 domain-containing protein [Nocardioides sp.]
MEMLPESSTSPAGVLAEARERVAVLTETMWAAKSADDLLSVAVELQRLRSAVAAVQARVATEIAATDAAKTAGWVSAGDYLTHVAGGRRGHGQRVLRTARGLCGDRAATLVALAAGEVSPEHAEVIVTVIDRLPVDPSLRDQAERALLDQAATLNASELRRAGEHLLEVLDPDGTARAEEAALDRLERSAHLGRFLTLAEDGLGGVRVRGRGTVEDAGLIKTALHALAAPLPGTDPDCGQTGRDTRDCRDHGARCWDALVQTCLRAQEVDGLLPEDHGAKPRLTLTLSLEQLRTGLGAAVLDTGDVLSAAAVRRLACDAELIPAVLGSVGEVLDVGRSQRLVTTAIWKALVLRDRHCRFPGCRRMPLACDAHHLQHWADGGETSLDNLVLLCRAHHTLIHATPWQARLNPIDRRPEFRPPPRRRGGEHPPDDWIREPRLRE